MNIETYWDIANRIIAIINIIKDYLPADKLKTCLEKYGFNKKTGNGVVVLANYPPSMSKIPATVIGIKLLKELDKAEK